MSDSVHTLSAPPPTDIPPPGPNEGASLSHYLAFEQSLLQSAIALADTKASFILAIAIAIVLLSVNLQTNPGAPTLDAWRTRLLDTVVLTGALTAAAALATIFPRLRSTKTSPYFYWGSAEFAKPEAEYVLAARGAMARDEARIDGELRHLHRIAAVCVAKYKWLHFSLWFLILTAVVEGLQAFV